MTNTVLGRLCLALTASVLTLSATAGYAQDADRLSIDHIMQIKSVDSVVLSPDGRWVAYVVTRLDETKDKRFSRIFMSPVGGGEPIPMTAEYANAGSPQWSPDGKYLSFTGTRGPDDDAESQVWLLDRRGGEAIAYTDVKQGVDDYAWSPDSSKMVLVIQDPEPEKKETEDGDEIPEPYVIDRLQFKQDYVGYLDRRRTHLYLHDGEGDPVQITSGDFDDEDPQWSPDGRFIAFVSKRDGDPDANSNSDIWTVPADMAGGNLPLRQVTTNKGPDFAPAWSPDGESIAYITSTNPEKLWYDTEHLAIVSASGGSPNILTGDYDRYMYNPMFAPDGKSVLATSADGGNWPLVKVDISSKAVRNLTPGDVSIDGFDIAPNGTIALLKSTPTLPYEVHVLEGGTAKQIAFHNRDVLSGLDLGRMERLTVDGWNGDPVESFIYYPPGYEAGKPYPTIFDLHGGPVSQNDTGFSSWARLYAAEGYIAVLPNPHGSSGYGHDFTYALDKQWGVPDFADIDAIATYLVGQGISDADALGVGGWSYGGILTNYVITKTTRFAAAVSGASEVNVRANYGHDIYQNEWEVELGLPWENIEGWEAINAFNDLGKVTTPTLVIGGQEDWNVPIQNSEQLYQVLKRRGIDTQLVVYPDEHHSIRRPSFRRDRYERFMGWFDKYLK